MMYLFIYDQIYWKTLSEVKLFENKCDSFWDCKNRGFWKTKNDDVSYDILFGKTQQF